MLHPGILSDTQVLGTSTAAGDASSETMATNSDRTLPESSLQPTYTTNASRDTKPAQPDSAAAMQQRCSNCGVTTTPLWRRSPEGKTICNACGLYLKSRNEMRPGNRVQETLASKASEAPGGTCPGTGSHCNGTGGHVNCDGCPAFNQSRYRASSKAKAPSTSHESLSAPQGPSQSHTPDSNSIKPDGPYCNNCGTSTTPLWRRDTDGNPICNACGLYFRLHQAVRPVSFKKDFIRRRKRASKVQEEEDASPAKGKVRAQQERGKSSRPNGIRGPGHPSSQAQLPGTQRGRPDDPVSTSLARANGTDAHEDGLVSASPGSDGCSRIWPCSSPSDEPELLFSNKRPRQRKAVPSETPADVEEVVVPRKRNADGSYIVPDPNPVVLSRINIVSQPRTVQETWGNRAGSHSREGSRSPNLGPRVNDPAAPHHHEVSVKGGSFPKNNPSIHRSSSPVAPGRSGSVYWNAQSTHRRTVPYSSGGRCGRPISPRSPVQVGRLEEQLRSHRSQLQWQADNLKSMLQSTNEALESCDSMLQELAQHGHQSFSLRDRHYSNQGDFPRLNLDGAMALPRPGAKLSLPLPISSRTWTPPPTNGFAGRVGRGERCDC